MALSEHFKADGFPKKGMNQQEAYELVEKLNSEGEQVTPYQCTFCYTWHIGH
jgi:hypothetical protein